jgi:hypothetical protein
MFKLVIRTCDKCNKQKECVLVEDPHHDDEVGDFNLVVLCESCLQDELKTPKEVLKDPLNEKEWFKKHDGV